MLADYRADFYSLGSIFYHLLSGGPLFGEYVRGGVVTAESALEIAAAHRAQVPFPPTAGRQSLLDQLVLQLLEKTPDLRYQTAKGLIHDLRVISEGKVPENFVIGEVDQSARFKFPRRKSPLRRSVISGLYGRTEPLQKLMDAFRVVQISGNSGVCLVSGYPGAGKTYLIREALERMRDEGTVVACAKLDQYSEDVPYTAIVKPCQSVG